MASRKIGRQTPTKQHSVSVANSEYKIAVELYEQTGRKAQKWQSNLLKPILAKNKNGLWVHTKFGYAVPRRNGKNEIVAMRELYGVLNSEKILHTAHRTSTSHSAWERLCELLDKAKIPYKSLKASGRERIDLENGGRVDFRTRSPKGGLGEGFDLLVIDEAQEYTGDQESALKYVVTSSPNPQTIFCGTPPTPLSAGTVFTELRASIFDGGTKNAGWAEWSVEELSDPHDRKIWYETNPSLGTIFTERSIADEIGSDVIDFNVQRFGYWIKYNQKSAITKPEWEALQVEDVPPLKGRLFAGVKFGHDGARVALSIAVKTEDDRIFIETIDCQPSRNGTAWLLRFLSTADIQALAIDGQSGQALLFDEMKTARLSLKPILPTVREIIKANALWLQGIFDKTVAHCGQPSLTEAVCNCEKRPIGSSGGFGFKSQLEDVDVSLLDSALLAHWLAVEAKPTVKQLIRY